MKAPAPPREPPSPASGPVAARPSGPRADSLGDEGWTRPWSRRHPGRVRAIGFAISAAVHVFVLFLYPAITVRFGEMDPTIDPTAPSSVEGMEIVNLQAFESDEIDAPAEPEAELNPPPVALTVPTISLPGEDLPPAGPPAPPGSGLTTADRLRPATYEENLWMSLVPEAATLSEKEILQGLIYGQLEAFNDSMAIRAARAARGTDWTYTDEDGNRWGISPGKLHLGKLTIPLPFSFGTSAGASDDLLDALWMDRQIARSAGLLEADATIRERAAAIRARVDEERARRAASDSTRSGGG